MVQIASIPYNDTVHNNALNGVRKPTNHRLTLVA